MNLPFIIIHYLSIESMIRSVNPSIHPSIPPSMDPSIRLYIHHQQNMVIQQTSPKNSFEIVLLKLAVTYIQRSTTPDCGISISV